MCLFLFFETEIEWNIKMYADMTEEEHKLARMAWNEAEDEENAEVNLAEDRLCHSPEDMEIRARMKSFMQTRLKWSHRELHDALLYAGLDIPTVHLW